MVSYGSDLTAQRQAVHLSRNAFADLTSITRGRMWAIEHDSGVAPTDAELADIAQAFERIAQNPPQMPARTRTISRQSTTRTTKTSATRDATGALRTIPSLSRAGTGIDWSSLQRYADSVTQHDLDRYTSGPDPNAGFRLFSNSEVATFKDCRRKWWLAYYRKLRSRYISPLGALAIGNRIHRALQAYYVPEGYIATDPREALETIIALDWEKVERSIIPNGTRGDDLSTLKAKFDNEANLERIMIAGYIEWIIENGSDAELSVVSAEQYLEAIINLGDEYQPTKIIGKIDVRVHRRTDNARLFIDHKTAASLTAAIPTLAFNPQMLHYHLLELLQSDETETCNGAVYNMLRKVKRTANAKPPFYDRIEVRHNPNEIINYEHQLVRVLREISDIENELDTHSNNDAIRPAHHGIVYPSPSNECTWKCPFFSLCNSFNDGSRVEDMIQEHFTQCDVFDYYRNTEENEGFDV